MKDNHISPIEAVESISRISDEPPSGENISFDTATTPFSVDSFVLKLFNLHDDQAERINVYSGTDGLHVYIRLKPVPCRCSACGNMTDKVKGYKTRKITHSVITTTPCFIDYDQRRMRCTECGRTFAMTRDECAAPSAAGHSLSPIRLRSREKRYLQLPYIMCCRTVPVRTRPSRR